MLTIYACTKNVFQELIFCFLNVSYYHTFVISGTSHHTHTHEIVVKLFKPSTTIKSNESMVPSIISGKFRIHSTSLREMDFILFEFTSHKWF